MKNFFFSLFSLVILSTQTSCLPVLIDENLRTTSQPTKLDSLFNRAQNLHYIGDDQTYKWLHENRNILYVGVATPIRVTVPIGARLVGSNLNIEKDNQIQDLYYITAEYPVMNATLILETLQKKQKGKEENETQNIIETFYVRPAPMPVLQLPIKIFNGHLVSAYDAKNLREFSLKLNVLSKENLEIHCPCLSFTLERIDKTGNRKSAISKTGEFTTEIIDLLAEATSEDIYLFKQVTTRCSKNDIARTLPTYTIEIE